MKPAAGLRKLPNSNCVVDLLTPFLHGKPYHMKHSGYEAIVDFLTDSRVIYVGDFPKVTKLSYPLRLAHILPRSYSSLDAELAALRSDGKILHHLYAEDTLWISMFPRFMGSRAIVAAQPEIKITSGSSHAEDFVNLWHTARSDKIRASDSGTAIPS